MDALLAVLFLLSELLYGTGTGELVFSPPPQAAYWEVAIYGAADEEAEFPLYLYSQDELIGLCGAPVHALAGRLSYCMTTNRFPARGDLQLAVSTEQQTDWVLEVRFYRERYINYLPLVGKE